MVQAAANLKLGFGLLNKSVVLAPSAHHALKSEIHAGRDFGNPIYRRLRPTTDCVNYSVTIQT
jgi:hypothetical protein